MELNENSLDLSEFDMDLDIDEEKISLIRILHDLKVAREGGFSKIASSGLDSSVASSHYGTCCPSPEPSEQDKVNKALQLNIFLEEKLKELNEIFNERFIVSQRKLAEVQIKINLRKETKQTPIKFGLNSKSYFKDKQNYPPPDNEDTVYMADNQLFDFREVASVPGWTVKDQKNFIKLIRTMSEEIMVRKLNSKIAELNRAYKNATKIKRGNIKAKIAATEKEIKEIHKKDLKDIVLPINEDYDWERANKFLERHTAQEYEYLWKLFLHPSINKSKWTSEEHNSLQKIAAVNNHEDWEKIAMELNTGRTAYQCFVYYRTNMSHICVGVKWTLDEELYLMRLIRYYQEGQNINWGKVATCIENRTKMQIYNKYCRLAETRKGRFAQEEDAVILKSVARYGTNYRNMLKFLPGRSVAQLRVRHKLLQRNQIVLWTVEEDKILMSLMSDKNFEGGFSKIAELLPGKDRVNVRTRYYTLVKWVKANPHLDLSNAPRRTRRLDKQQDIEKEDFGTAIRKLQQRLKCESVHGDISEEDYENVDDAITEVILSKDNGVLKGVEVKLAEELAKGGAAVNETNLKKLFFLLKVNFDREQFQNSVYSKKYTSLLEKERILTVKSYSRKNTINTKNTDCGIDIWGNAKLGPSDFVFPPHLATIYGLVRLMQYCNESNESKHTFSISLLTRKNPVFKEKFYLLQERFSFLFLWPFLLSKMPPKNFMPSRASQSRSSDNDNTLPSETQC